MLHITLRQLKVFDAVALHTSYSRAAEYLHLSQPAVSMQIKQLEEAVGLPLFDQIGKKIYMTEAGHELQRYSSHILQQLTEAESVFSDMKGLRQGKLMITVATTASYFMPQLLGEFNRRFPGITISLDVANREVLLQRLARNETDVAIMGRPPAGLGLEAVSFMENPLVVIAPPQHPLAREQAIPLSRLQQETFLVREQGSGTRIAMERFFSEQGIRLSKGSEMSTNEAIKQAVQAGMGLGILSLNTVTLELETHRLTVLDAEGFPILRHWYVVHREGKRLSTVAQAFKMFLLEDLSQQVT